MSIQQNDDPQGQPRSDQGGNQNTESATFSGTSFSAAPSGGNPLLTLKRLINIDQADSTVEPYLKEVLENIRTALPNVTYERCERLNGSYAFKFEGPDGLTNFFCILFVPLNESVSPKRIPASMRLAVIIEELRERYSNQKIKIADARVILSGYQPEMERAVEMAGCIVRTFSVTSIPEAKNATIDALLSNEFSVSWNLSDAQQLERHLSPHAVAPRMDFGMTLSAKIQYNYSSVLKEHEVDYQPLGVIGGYVEVRGPEPVMINNQRQMRFRPIVNITVCNSIIPLEGVAAVLLAAIAPTIYNSLWYASQWSNLAEGEPNPGLLIMDDSTGRPYQLKTKDEVKEFIEAYFTTPEIAFQFQDGRDTIPNMFRLSATSSAEKNTFGERLTNFFVTPQVDLSQVVISQNFDTRFEGVFGDMGGKLKDSREIDYLWLAAKNGVNAIDARVKSILMNGSDNPTDRAMIVDEASGGLKPLYLTTSTVINATFIKDLVDMTVNRGLTMVDPNSRMEARPFGSFVSGFGSSSGINSPVSSGFTNRGFGIGSVWN